MIDLIALIVAMIAAIISMVAIIQQQKFFNFNKEEAKPVCKIKVTSKGDTLSIRLLNVGMGVMFVDKVYYTNENDKENKDNMNLSKLFENCPCRTRTEERVSGEYMQPGSTNYLYTSSFENQDDLLATWKVIKTLTIKVVYKDAHGKNNPIMRYR